MNIYSLNQLVAMAKYTSPVYADLYRDVVPGCHLSQLPVLSNEELMRVVHAKRPDFVFSEGNTHGLIFESSASTGKAKVTIWGQGEWSTSMELLSAYHWKHGLLRNGDRIANLCASPYLSFRIVHSVIERFPGSASEVPLGCDMPFGDLNDAIEKYECNVLAGVNSTILGLAWQLLSAGRVNYSVERILAGGELLYGKQSEVIRQAFPGARMVSFMFGTTESGITGYSELDDPLDTFSPFPEASLVEILDEKTNLPILEEGVTGKCVVTSFVRFAAPAIRMDTGDYAQWVNRPSNGRPLFKVTGRRFPFKHTFEGVSFSESEVWVAIQRLQSEIPVLKLQVLLHLDRIEVVVALLDELPTTDARAAVCTALCDAIPGLIAHEKRMVVTIVGFGELLEQTRRKGRLVLDCRKTGHDDD